MAPDFPAQNPDPSHAEIPKIERHRTKLAIATLLAKDGTRLRTEFPETFLSERENDKNLKPRSSH